MAKHRTHSVEFKRQVAQEYIAGETLHALTKRHDLSRNLSNFAQTPLDPCAYAFQYFFPQNRGMTPMPVYPKDMHREVDCKWLDRTARAKPRQPLNDNNEGGSDGPSCGAAAPVTPVGCEYLGSRLIHH